MAVQSEFAEDREFREILTLYVQELPQRLQAFRDTFAQQQWNLLSTLAHQMKGAAGMYGYPQLTELASELERAARTQQHELVQSQLNLIEQFIREIQAGFAMLD